MNQPQLFESRIKEDVVFGEGVKVVTPVNLYGWSIGNNCFIGPFVEIQKDVSIGDNTNVVVGAGAVVTKDITEPGVYAGNPARKIRSI